MKNTKLVLFAFFGLVLFAFDASAQFDRRGDYVALYRLYNSRTNDHLYTTSCEEKDSAMRNNNYAYEGVAAYVAARQLRRTIPLYRLLLANGEHFYTIDQNEVNDLTRNGNNTSEGIAGYVASSQQRNTVPLYRLLGGDRHLYTTNEQEKNDFLRNSNSRLEGIAGYVWTSGTDSCGSSGGGNTGDYPVIYSGTDYTGASQVLDRDWNVSGDWDGSPNTIGSIRVPRGWYVVIYRRSDFRGDSYDLSTDAIFDNNNRWRNRIRSIKVYKGNPPR